MTVIDSPANEALATAQLRVILGPSATLDPRLPGEPIWKWQSRLIWQEYKRRPNPDVRLLREINDKIFAGLGFKELQKQNRKEMDR